MVGEADFLRNRPLSPPPRFRCTYHKRATAKMPFEYNTIPENRIVRSRLYGTVDLADCLNLLYSLTLERDSFDQFRAICDARGATAALPIDALFSLTSFVRSYKDRFSGIRWATVANTHLEFGLAQSIGLMLRDLPLEYRAFRTIDEACRWQGLPLAMFDEPSDAIV